MQVRDQQHMLTDPVCVLLQVLPARYLEEAREAHWKIHGHKGFDRLQVGNAGVKRL
jgi:hypothetical protein